VERLKNFYRQGAKVAKEEKMDFGVDCYGVLDVGEPT
jgi:hypothetical protein